MQTEAKRLQAQMLALQEQWSRSSVAGLVERKEQNNIIFFLSSVVDSLTISLDRKNPSKKIDTINDGNRKIVRPGQIIDTENREDFIKLLKEKIIIPANKEDQPYLDLLVGPVRTMTTAAFLAAASSGIYDDLYYQIFKYYGRHADADPIVIRKKEKGFDTRIFIKSTLGPLKSELFDPVAILVELGYDPRKIRVIQTLRDPSEIYFSIRRMEVDRMSPDEFKEMYIFIMSLFSRYILDINSDTPRPITIFFELVKEYSEQNNIEELMGVMFGKRFYPTFPSLEELLEMNHVHWLEADPHDPERRKYFDKFVAPALNVGRFSGGISFTNIDEMIEDNNDLKLEAAQLVTQASKYIALLDLLAKK